MPARFHSLCAATLLAAWPLLAATPSDLDRAEKLYQMTDYDGSLAVLQSIEPRDGAVYEWMGRNYMMQGAYKKATETLEKAVAVDPANAQHELWLGRAFGRRAESSSPFTAPANAAKARQHFEKAVELNPHSVEALSDLFEYYLEAPGFLGGGLDKAAGVADQMAVLEPAEGHWAQARLAEKKKQFSTAEEHLQLAAQAAPKQVRRFIDLAKFLAKQGRYQESEQSFRKAEKIAPDSPEVIWARASTYIEEGRNLPDARKLLERYMQAQLSPEDPPRSAAEKLLKKASGG